jgi:hypothetical protein
MEIRVRLFIHTLEFNHNSESWILILTVKPNVVELHLKEKNCWKQLEAFPEVIQNAARSNIVRLYGQFHL